MKNYLTLILLFLALPAFSDSPSPSSQMWVKVEIASDTSIFYINLPTDGCVSLIVNIPGKKQGDRVWGPRFMKKGAFKLNIPTARINEKEGIVELFNINLKPEQEIGNRGNGERQFNSPMGIDYDLLRQEILIADTGNDRIIRLARDGRYLGKHGGFGLSFGDKTEEKEDSLDNPYDITTGGFSNFYVSDQNNKRICVFDSYRSYKGKFYPADDTRRNALNRPKGISVDNENNLWIIDGRSDKAIKIAANGDKLLEIGGFGKGEQQLSAPNQIAIGQNGEIYIADTGKSRIAVFDRLGTYLRSITSGLKKPFAVTVDTDGLLIICEQTPNQLHILTPQGEHISTINQASDNTNFKNLSDVTCNNTHIYLLDAGKHRISFIEKQKEATYVSWQATNAVIK